MVIGAWFFVTYMNVNDSWKSKVQEVESEKICVQAAKWKWDQYWKNGHKDDSKMRIECHDSESKMHYFVRCNEYGSCTIK